MVLAQSCFTEYNVNNGLCISNIKLTKFSAKIRELDVTITW